jgi:hypothetical protein
MGWAQCHHEVDGVRCGGAPNHEGDCSPSRKQCQARHGQKMHLRCQATLEKGVACSVHWAIDEDGATVRWNDLAAMRPVFSDGIANPDRTKVGNGSARLAQVGGEHYKKFKIQPWDVIDEYDLSFYAGNALKYLLRAGHKGSKIEDLRKARHYLDKMIELESGDG